MIKSNIKIFGVFFLVALSFTFCKKKDVVFNDGWDDFSRPLNVASPAIDGDFTAVDLLKRIDSTTAITVDNDGLIHFRYEEPIEAVWSDLIKIDYIGLKKMYKFPLLSATSSSNLTFTERIKINDKSNQRFDSMYIHESTLEVVVNPPSASANYTITFPGLTNKNGKPLILKADFNSPLDKSIDLAGYKLIFKQSPTNDSSYFEVITVVSNLGSNSTSSKLNVSINMRDLIPEITFGYFDKMQIINENHDLKFHFFEDFDFFENVKMKGITVLLDVNNYMGIGFSTKIDNAIATNEKSGSSVNLLFEKDVLLSLDQAQYSEDIIPKKDSVKFDDNNLNIDEMINIYPDKINFDASVESKPSGVNDKNFISRKSKFDGKFIIDFPFWLKTSNYNRIDTLKFILRDYIDSSSVKMVNSLGLYFEFENGFPFEINSQLYLANKNNVIIDSLFNDGDIPFWKSGSIGINGKVLSSENTPVSVLLDNKKVQKLYDNDVTKILVKSYVETSNKGSVFVKLYQEYGVKMKFGFEVQSREISTNN